MQLTSKRIEVSDALECVEYFYRENMTDGLPVVPPTEQRVQQFLDAARCHPTPRLLWWPKERVSSPLRSLRSTPSWRDACPSTCRSSWRR